MSATARSGGRGRARGPAAPDADDVRLAHRLADVAAQIALSRFGQDVPSRAKADGSPVSEADLAVERTLLDILRAERPHDAVLSEESGARATRSARRWILDPIDGTIPYLAGGRAWGTHIALEIDGELSVAVLTRPTEGRRWWAVRGGGAYTGALGDPAGADRRLSVSATDDLSRARVGGFVPPAESPAAAAIAARATWVEDEISVIAALVEGRLDAVLDEGGNPWDQAPGALLVTEAGGVFCDPTGGRRLDLAWCLYGNRAIHAALMDVLKDHLPPRSPHALTA